MTSRFKCPKCLGKGKIIIKKKQKCPTCHGMGSTKLVVGSKKTGKNACPDCKGSGFIYKEIEKTCPECGGKGRIQLKCVVCGKPTDSISKICNTCKENLTVYQVVLPATHKVVEFNKIYIAKVVSIVDFGYFVALAPKIEGLIREKYSGNKGDQIYVKLKQMKGGKFEFIRIDLPETAQVSIKRVHDTVAFEKINKKREVGSFFTVHARVEGIRQIPRGPRVFSLLDETGIIEAAAFNLEAANNIKVGDIVEVMGEYTRHRGSEQIEISDIFVVEEAYAKAFKRKMGELLDKKSEPEDIDFLVRSEVLDFLKPKFKQVAKRIRRAILELQPVIIRHHNDTDGITSGIALEVALRELWFELFGQDEDQLRHIVKRTVNKPPFYDPLDAVRDLDFALSDQDRFGDKLPLVVMLDTGSSEESLFSYKLLKAYGIEIIVVDHHFPSATIQETIDTHLNVYFAGGDYNICSGMLGVEVARFINPKITDEINHLPAIAGKGDRVEGDVFKQYLEIALSKGYLESFLEDIALAVDYQAYFLKFSPGRLLLSDLLGLQGQQERQVNYVRLLASEAQQQLEDQLKISLEYVQEETLLNGLNLAILDVEKYTSRFDFPPPGKITGSLFDHLVKQKPDQSLVTIGLGPDFAIFRSQNVKLDFPNLVKNCAQKLPRAGVEGGGHEIVGSMKFITGAREEIIDIVKELLTLIELK
ncbi:MAG: DHH family phosphoesterase [Candidatus Hodarchaeales archaeon]